MKKVLLLVVAVCISMVSIGCGKEVVFVEDDTISVYVDGGAIGGSVYSGSRVTIENLIASLSPGESRTIKVASGDELGFMSNSGGGVALTIESYVEVYFNDTMKWIVSPVEDFTE
jgi:hypothetical protein